MHESFSRSGSHVLDQVEIPSRALQLATTRLRWRGQECEIIPLPGVLPVAMMVRGMLEQLLAMICIGTL